MTDKTDDKAATSKADDRRALAARAEALVTELVAMDAMAREQGHSLAEVLVVAAKNQFGIDIRYVEPTEDGVDA